MFRSPTTRILVAALVAFAVQLCTGAHANAQASPLCAAKCIPIFEKHMTALFKKATKSLKNGTPIDPLQITKIRSKTQQKWSATIRSECSQQACSGAYPNAPTACELRITTFMTPTLAAEARIFGINASPQDFVLVTYLNDIWTLGGCIF